MDNQNTTPVGYSMADAIVAAAIMDVLSHPQNSQPQLPPEPEKQAVEPVKEEAVKEEPVEPKKIEEKKVEPKAPPPKKAEEIIPKAPEKNLEPRLLPADKLVPQTNYKDSPEFSEIAHYFQVPKQEFEEAKHKLSLIVDWGAYQAQSKKIGDILTQIRNLEHRIPAPEPGERRYMNMFRFVKLSQI